MFVHIIHSTTGLVHLAAACLAMILGALVLSVRKGTLWHRRAGYGYVSAMLLVNLTAFMIYHLWGRFAIFHWFALLSALTLMAGMLPVWLMKSREKAIGLHLSFMYWSVVGLYAAFVSEVLVRWPHPMLKGNFALAVNGGVGLVMITGGIAFALWRRKWEQEAGG